MGASNAMSGVARWVGNVRYRARGETGYAGFELDGEHYRLGDTVLLKSCEEGEDVRAAWPRARAASAPSHARTGTREARAHALSPPAPARAAASP